MKASRFEGLKQRKKTKHNYTGLHHHMMKFAKYDSIQFTMTPYVTRWCDIIGITAESPTL